MQIGAVIRRFDATPGRSGRQPKRRPREFPFLPGEGQPDLLPKALATVLGRLSDAGYNDVICTDLSNADVGIPVAHVVVPGLANTLTDPRRRRRVRGG